jgi:deazaflavin-dependent oxidoreductase (nitroreductase family)
VTIRIIGTMFPGRRDAWASGGRPRGGRRLAAMPIEDEYEPSAWDWVSKQVDLYESSGGAEGSTLQGVPCVIVTMRGRRTGKVRKVAVIRIEHDGTYAAVASKGGADHHPGWYLNLLANPDVTVQDGPMVQTLRAREVGGDEKIAWWGRAVEAWPAYDDYQRNTDRVIPVIVFEPPG